MARIEPYRDVLAGVFRKSFPDKATPNTRRNTQITTPRLTQNPISSHPTFSNGKTKMPIWVDADACPVPVKEILCRAAERWKITTTFIANHVIRLPPSPFIKARQVMQGFDVADNEIVEQLSQGDLVITQDIPLAADAIEKGADVFNPRGVAFTRENIRQRLAMRNFMEEMRNAGQVTGGPSEFSQSDRKHFADQLDRWLQKNTRPSG